MDHVDFIRTGKAQAERDAEIAGIAHVLIVISSRSEDGTRFRPALPTGRPPRQQLIDLHQSAHGSGAADQASIWEEPVSIGNREDRAPRGNSIDARPAGLPGLGKKR